MNETTGGCIMNAQGCFDLFDETDLRQCIIDNARRLASSADVQERLVKHAWYVLSVAPPQRTDYFYRSIAVGAMEKEKRQIRYLIS